MHPIIGDVMFKFDPCKPCCTSPVKYCGVSITLSSPGLCPNTNYAGVAWVDSTGKNWNGIYGVITGPNGYISTLYLESILGQLIWSLDGDFPTGDYHIDVYGPSQICDGSSSLVFPDSGSLFPCVYFGESPVGYDFTVICPGTNYFIFNGPPIIGWSVVIQFPASYSCISNPNNCFGSTFNPVPGCVGGGGFYDVSASAGEDSYSTDCLGMENGFPVNNCNYNYSSSSNGPCWVFKNVGTNTQMCGSVTWTFPEYIISKNIGFNPDGTAIIEYCTIGQFLPTTADFCVNYCDGSYQTVNMPPWYCSGGTHDRCSQTPPNEP
jgi:hypothetical protein